MDYWSAIATVWMYLFPLILVTSILVVLTTLIFPNVKVPKSLRFFSRVFTGLILFAFIFYLVILAFDPQVSFKELNPITLGEAFYYWVYYLAILFILTGLVLVIYKQKI